MHVRNAAWEQFVSELHEKSSLDLSKPLGNDRIFMYMYHKNKIFYKHLYSAWYSTRFTESYMPTLEFINGGLFANDILKPTNSWVNTQIYV